MSSIKIARKRIFSSSMIAFYHLSSALLSVETVCFTKEPRKQWRQSLLRITLSVHFRNYASSERRASLLYSSNPRDFFFSFTIVTFIMHTQDTHENTSRDNFKKKWWARKKMYNCTEFFPLLSHYVQRPRSLKTRGRTLV